MNTGQVMFIHGAFAMLSMLALNVNRTMIGSLVLGLEMEATLNAFSIGQSMLDEVMQKNFDEKTFSNDPTRQKCSLSQYRLLRIPWIKLIVCTTFSYTKIAFPRIPPA